MTNKQMERGLSKYQNINIISIFIIGIIESSIIIGYLKGANLKNLGQIDRINMFNLFFKSLSLTITVFLPVILIDIVYFATIDKSNKDKGKIEKLQKGSKLEATRIVVYIGILYSMVMVGNIREWLNNMYNNSLNYNSLEKIYNIEIFFMIVIVILVIAALTISIISKKREI